MANLSSELRCRCSLYEMQDVENELSEITHRPVFLRKLRCKIVPKSGREVDGKGESSYSEITHEVTIRRNSAEGIRREMYLEYLGQRLEIRYIMPHYKDRDRVVLYCREVVV